MWARKLNIICILELLIFHTILVIQYNEGNATAFSEFQQVVMGLKREHKDSLDRIQQGQEVSLFNLRGEQAEKLCQYENRIRELEMEVEKLRTFSAIQVGVFFLALLFYFSESLTCDHSGSDRPVVS